MIDSTVWLWFAVTAPLLFVVLFLGPGLKLAEWFMVRYVLWNLARKRAKALAVRPRLVR